MRITVISATGGIGRALVEQAVAAGHDVTAVARNPSRILVPGPVRPGGPTRPRTGPEETDQALTNVHKQKIGVDLDDVSPGAVRRLEEAVTGADAVLSGLGASRRRDAGIATRGTRALIQAMRVTGTRRLVVVSAAPVAPFRTPPQPDEGLDRTARFVAYPLLRRLLREIYADHGRMEDDLAVSGLDGTAVRPPRLTDGPLTGVYRTAVDRSVPGGTTISRADVAHLMLDLAARPETAGHTVSCGY